MSQTLTLMRHSLWRLRGLLIAATSLLFLFQIMLTMVASSFHRAGRFSQLASFIPDFIRPLLDSSFLGALSFSGLVSMGYTHPIVLILLIAQATHASTEPVGEIESKFVDLLMARPLARVSTISRSIGVSLVLTLASVGSMVLGTWAGMALIAPDGVSGPEVRTIVSLAGNLTMLVLAWGSIALVVASLSKHRGGAAAITGFLAVATFILDYLGRLWEPIELIAPLSPFHYYSPLPLILGQPLPWIDVVALAVIWVVGTCTAIALYRRRDL